MQKVAPEKRFLSENFHFKIFFKAKFLQALVNFTYYIQKHFADVSKMWLVTEISLFGIILKILIPEDENIEFSKSIFQAPLNSTSDYEKLFCCTKIKNMSQELFNKRTSV